MGIVMGDSVGPGGLVMNDRISERERSGCEGPSEM
jgi:hypothetical protein